MCLHELFEESVRRNPSAVAISHAGHTMSYRELDECATALADYMRQRNITTETRVAVCIERSVELIVAFLAVLKAGGTYVPLDPSHPPERLRYLVSDSRSALVLSNGSFPAGDVGAPVVDLNGARSTFLAGSAPTRPKVVPTNAAYVIYTSGTTGRPKGVVVTHANIVSQIDALRSIWKIDQNDSVLQFASPTFDVSLQEIGLAFSSAARLVLRTSDWVASPPDFWNACRKEALTFINIPTRFWELLCTHPLDQIPTSLRMVVFGGEAVNQGAIARWFADRTASVRLFQAYGPTETTVNVTLNELTADPSSWKAIGRPLPSAHLYITNETGELVAPGIPGELCVGGMGVARGYAGRSRVTAERFVPDPFSAADGSRMYRTGDRGRWSEDGRVEFLGRLDDQVKIRGYRIEPNEVARVLAAHADVRDAVVTVREVATGERALVAYYVPSASAESDESGRQTGRLRDFVSSLLPQYMVPAAYVPLDRIPLTPTGKLDRAGLPEPTEFSYARAEFELPSGELEKDLARVWEQILAVGHVGRDDNFFALGGHSLLAVQVISHVADRHPVHISVIDLFESPTIRGLASRILERYAQHVDTESLSQMLAEVSLLGSATPESGSRPGGI